MRDEVEAVFGQLVARGEREIALDVVGDVIGAMRISQDEIEQLFARLEQTGFTIAVPTRRLKEHLRPVLEHARRLKQQTNATPDVVAISRATGLSVAEVRAALLFASVMGR
jgi:hypothetical protein